MNILSEPFAKATSTISQADPISLIDSVSSFLKLLERFNSIVDGIAEVCYQMLSLSTKICELMERPDRPLRQSGMDHS